MKWLSHVFSAASGSVGGLTYSHNAGGNYVRAKTIPTNPASPFQEAVRNIVAFLTGNWNINLTAAQRATWKTYADNVNWTDKQGQQITLSALAHYVRSNVPRLQAGLARVDDAPFIMALATFGNPAFGFAAATQEAAVQFLTGNNWVDTDGSAMLVYISRQQLPTIDYFKGPYRFAAAILGDSATPPTSPAAIAAPFAGDIGNRVFFKVSVTEADGRLSEPFRDFAVSA